MLSVKQYHYWYPEIHDCGDDDYSDDDYSDTDSDDVANDDDDDSDDDDSDDVANDDDDDDSDDDDSDDDNNIVTYSDRKQLITQESLPLKLYLMCNNLTIIISRTLR